MAKKPFLSKMSAKSKHTILRTAVAILIGLGLATILIYTTCSRPKTAIRLFFTAPLQSWSYFSLWLEKAIPLMFTGTAVCIMFSANQFNLAMEGAVMLGGFFGGALVNIYLLPGKTIAGIAVGSLIGGLVGALITFIPAILYKTFNASIMVTSLMMNYICLWMSNYLLGNYFKDPKTSFGTYQWAPNSKPIMVKSIDMGNHDVLKIYYALPIALIVVFVGWFLLYKTNFGYKLRQVGENSKFANYVGTNVVFIALASQIIGGFIGGIGGANYIMTNFTTYNIVDLTGLGWDGVTMAVFSRNNPKNVPIAALFIGYLKASAYIMSIKVGVQHEFTQIIQGVIVVFLLAEQFLSKTYRKMIIAEANSQREDKKEAE